MMSDAIDIVEEYRGVGIHADQPKERIETVVKPAIDAVQKMTNINLLADYAGNTGNPPEARILAAEMAHVIWDVAAQERRVRPDIDLERVRATIAGLSSRRWRSAIYYCSLLDPPDPPGLKRALRREQPLESSTAITDGGDHG